MFHLLHCSLGINDPLAPLLYGLIILSVDMMECITLEGRVGQSLAAHDDHVAHTISHIMSAVSLFTIGRE